MTHFVRIMKSWMSGISATEPHSAAKAGTPPEHFPSPVTILNSIGNEWHCWRLRSETDRMFAFRLALHLQTLAIAIEDDLERVLAAEQACQRMEQQ